jgi:hypothetical protein
VFYTCAPDTSFSQIYHDLVRLVGHSVEFQNQQCYPARPPLKPTSKSEPKPEKTGEQLTRETNKLPDAIVNTANKGAGE